jgi:pyruvate dehydrogenase E2 component (dihydrolipoamide acetyltransferase)
MDIEVRLPQFGMGMLEGTIVQWFKKVGDTVEAGEILAEIEAAKATEELAAPGSGVLHEILVPEGSTVPVHELLARLGPVAEGVAEGRDLVEVPEVGMPAAARNR